MPIMIKANLRTKNAKQAFMRDAVRITAMSKPLAAKIATGEITQKDAVEICALAVKHTIEVHNQLAVLGRLSPIRATRIRQISQALEA